MFKWYAKKFYNENLVIGDGKETAKKLKLFGYSLLIGLVLAVTILMIAQVNPFLATSYAFKQLSEYKSSQDRLISKIAIFGLAGIAVGIGFKTGLFNIGVSGQMIFSGLLTGLLALTVGSNMPTGLGQIIILIIAIAAGALLAAIAGALKAYLGIHEVVTTILLNWIMFFLMQAVVKDFLVDYSNATQTGTIDFGMNFLFAYSTVNGPMGGWIAIALLIVVAISIYLLIYKTSFGHKMVIVGKNYDAALASGVNVKVVATASMAISGAVAGVLGIVVYFIQNQNLTISLVDAIPQYGFDGIAIAILAFSNPMAILPVAVIFGLIQGIIDNVLTIDPTFGSLVTGLLIFIAAINVIFNYVNFKLLFLKIFRTKEYIAQRRVFIKKRNQINQTYYSQYEDLVLIKKQAIYKHKKAYKSKPESGKYHFKRQVQIAKTKFKTNFEKLINSHNLALVTHKKEVKQIKGGNNGSN